MDSDVASTARVNAAFRALDTFRAHPLVHDPWTAALAGADLVASFAAEPPDIQARAASYTVIRTRVFDDWLGSAAHCPQVVLLCVLTSGYCSLLLASHRAHGKSEFGYGPALRAGTRLAAPQRLRTGLARCGDNRDESLSGPRVAHP